MARLRKASPSDSDVFLPPPPPSTLRPASRRTLRESPSKRELRYTSNIDDSEESFLVPKPSAPNTPSRRQRTLKPVALNTTLLQKCSVDNLRSPEKSVRRPRRDDGLGYLYPRSLAKTAAKKGKKISAIDDTTIFDDTAALQGTQEAETSVLCGDEQDEMLKKTEEQLQTELLGETQEPSQEEEEENVEKVVEHEDVEKVVEQENAPKEESSEDEDPIVNVKSRRQQTRRRIIDSSDSEFEDARSDADSEPEFKLPALPPPSRSRATTTSSWTPTEEIIDLTSSPPTKLAAKPAPPLSKPAPFLSSSSRPTSSASNDVNAILQYSPTPTKQRSPRKAPPVSRPSTPSPPPSPSKLVSPSKKKNRIPNAPALRPSLDAFWSADIVNSWNDTHSPAKNLVSPRKKKLLSLLDSATKKDFGYDSDDSFHSPTASPRKKSQSPTKKSSSISPTVVEARKQRKEFATTKDAIARQIIEEIDTTITKGEVTRLSESTGGIKLVWSKTLNTTAGRANWRRETVKLRTGPDPTDFETSARHHCSIELAEKVIDDEERLWNVLAHEYCHLTTFMISNQRTNPHGKEFKSWAAKVTKAFEHKGVEVTTKHSYQITFKYIWECVSCGYEFKRHSKSIDTTRHSCGRCKGKLVQTKPVPRGNAKDGGKKEKSEYQIFVKAHFSRVKKQLEAEGKDSAMGKVMERLGQEYRAQKEEKSKKEVGEVELALEALSLGEKGV